MEAVSLSILSRAETCTYELPPAGLLSTHDDRVISAALVALLAAGEPIPESTIDAT